MPAPTSASTRGGPPGRPHSRPTTCATRATSIPARSTASTTTPRRATTQLPRSSRGSEPWRTSTSTSARREMLACWPVGLLACWPVGLGNETEDSQPGHDSCEEIEGRQAGEYVVHAGHIKHATAQTRERLRTDECGLVTRQHHPRGEDR